MDEGGAGERHRGSETTLNSNAQCSRNSQWSVISRREVVRDALYPYAHVGAICAGVLWFVLLAFSSFLQKLGDMPVALSSLVYVAV